MIKPIPNFDDTLHRTLTHCTLNHRLGIMDRIVTICLKHVEAKKRVELANEFPTIFYLTRVLLESRIMKFNAFSEMTIRFLCLSVKNAFNIFFKIP